MNTNSKASLLHVAFTSKATMQQPPLNDATSYATTTQHDTRKTASLLNLARNKLRNNHTTTTKKSVQQAPQKQGVDVARSELARLVHFCGEAYGFTEEEHAEALAVALADFDSAMICFKAIERETLPNTASAKHSNHMGDTYPLPKVKERSPGLPDEPQTRTS